MTGSVSLYLTEVVRAQGIPFPLQEPHTKDEGGDAGSHGKPIR